MRINFSLLDLRAFLAIFDFGNFHKAAELLNLSQPALSRRMRTLETRLGVALFERSTRNVTPTSAGRRFEPVARRLLDELDSSILAISGMDKQQGGQITVASIPTVATFFLPKVIRHFNQTHPLIRWRVLDRSPQEVLECVISGEAEFGINMIGAVEADVTFTPLMEDPYVLVCHREHPLAQKKNLTWQALTSHPLIRIGRDNSGNRALLDLALTRANVRLDWFCEVNNLTTSLGLVEAGLGATVLPRLATLQGQHPVIITKPLRSPEVTRTIGVVERRKGHLSPAAKSFREVLLSRWKLHDR